MRIIDPLRAAGLLFLAVIIPGVLLPAQRQPVVLPTLTTTWAAHHLSIDESRRAHPVGLRAVVTYYDPYIDPRPLFFVSDSTGCIYVALSVTPAVPLKAGQLVEVTGVSGAGDFAPIVERASVRLIGDSHLPSTATHVSVTSLLTGEEDGQWVEVEGVVRAVVETARKIVFKLALSDGEINATTMREYGADYGHFVDARILLRGNTGPLFNHRRQNTGWSLLFPGLATVKVEEPAPLLPFASPVIPLNRLLSYSPDTAFRHRAHIRGIVTLFWPGRMLCLQDGAQGLCAQTAQTNPLQPGELADVIGFPAVGEFSPILTEANYTASGGRRPVLPVPVTASQAFSGDHDAELVEIVGQVIGEDRAAKDPSILLSSGNLVFSLIWSSQSRSQRLPTLEEGGTVRVTGICSVQSSARENRHGFLIPKSFRILLRSPEDVLVVRRPSWWNAAHTLRVLALALLIIVLTAVALFRQVRRGIRTASELRRAEEATRSALEQMEHQAHHDPLTGLANRLMFDKSILSLLDLAGRTGQQVGLLCLDLDRFKAINDTLGHAAGDIVLRQAAQRLTGVSPEKGIVARLGGDEFALLLPGISGRVQAEAIARRVIEVLAAPFMIDGTPRHCPASIGLSLFPEDAQSAATLQRNADTALYHAKRTSPGQVVAFDRSMSEHAERSVLLENALRRALERNSFSLVYQPQFSARGDLHGFEALLRLNDEILGAVVPAEFIPVAEELGLIARIGEWMLREACRQWTEWAEDGKAAVSMAVNVSALQLESGDFPAFVRNLLAQMRMPAELLELELTESVIFAHAGQALSELKAIGVRIAVDDLGTCLSSLSSLYGSPVHYIKIDRSFVRDAASTPGTLPFIRMIVSLARGLGMRTVAEGVETPGQMEAVKRAGCDIVQGDLLSHPLTAKEASSLLQVSATDRWDTFESELPESANHASGYDDCPRSTTCRMFPATEKSLSSDSARALST